jgi:tetratricopeptide (TPR) repeat protein
MAYWGIAYARGPNYNKAFDLFDPKDLDRAFETCRAALDEASWLVKWPGEAALVEALAKRFPEDRSGGPEAWSAAYMEAVTKVYEQYPDELDVAALYADAMMNMAPWLLWDLHTGQPNPKSRTMETEQVLEKAILDKRARRHPGILHLYIHLMEMSPTPERAIVAGDYLRGLVPDGGHLNHMPGHLDLLTGDYRRAIASNMDAIRGDEKYMHHGSTTDFYSFYRLHDYTFPIYAATLNGQYEVAVTICDRMELSLTEEVLRVESPPMIDWLEGYLSYRPHVLIRFGKWQDILDTPFPADQAFYCVTVTTMHYARGIAHSVLGDIDSARKEQALFRDARTKIAPTRFSFPNTWKDIFDVGEAMLEGEIAYRQGRYQEAWKHLEEATYKSDHLIYAEPWAWMQPPRHALGALLLEQGETPRAAKAFAEDLGYDTTLPRAVRHPNNVWALKGYYDCLVLLKRDKEAEMLRPQLDIALAIADVEVERSCFCAAATANGDSCCK